MTIEEIKRRWPWWDIEADVRTLTGWIDEWALEYAYREIRMDDEAIARFEDEGGPGEVEAKPVRCGETWGTVLVCDRERGHPGDHRGYLEAHDEVLFWGTPRAGDCL